MWEVLSRQIPFEGNSLFFFFLLARCSVWIQLVWSNAGVCVCAASEVTNPMQIMFSVLRGMRPEINLDSLPAEIPSRSTLISLMTTGWTSNPDERPSFLSKCDHLYCETRQFFCCLGCCVTEARVVFKSQLHARILKALPLNSVKS